MSTDGVLRSVVWAGEGDPSYLLRPSLDSARFFAELADGRFVLRYCDGCGLPRYPHAPVCPYCGCLSFAWRPALASGTVLSWVRCHVAYVSELASLLPYVVLDVQMTVGVRIIARLADARAEPYTGMAVELVAERWPAGQAVPAFVSSRDGGSDA